MTVPTDVQEAAAEWTALRQQGSCIYTSATKPLHSVKLKLSSNF